LHHISARGARQLDRAPNVAGVASHENNSGGLHRDVCAGADCNSDIRRHKRWCIVYAIAHHCNSLAAGLEPLDGRFLIGRQDLRSDFIDAEPPRNRICYRLCIPCDHSDSDAELVQSLDCLGGLRPNLVFDRECADHGAVSKNIKNCLSFGLRDSHSLIEFGRKAAFLSASNLGPPTATLFEFTVARAPRPGNASKFPAGCGLRPR
jgi:hypothetical protein